MNDIHIQKCKLLLLIRIYLITRLHKKIIYTYKLTYGSGSQRGRE